MSYLEGIRVVDLGHYIAGPGTCGILANLGADVVKVEPPGGEIGRHVSGAQLVESFSYSRRSIVTDLKQQAGKEILHRLLATSDVLVQNLRPGTLERLGLSQQVIEDRYPHLITVNISGYPSTGPSAHRPGYDIAAQAGSGMMWVTGEAGGRPQPVGSSIIDVSATHIAAQAVLASLMRRHRTGRGDWLEISLLEVAVALQAHRFGLFAMEGTPPERNGGCQPFTAPASDVIETADGYIVLSAYAPHHWATLCRTLDLEELESDPRFIDAEVRARNRPELLALLADRIRRHSSLDIVEILSNAGLVVEEVRDYPKVLTDGDVVSSGVFAHPVGGIPLTALPYRSASAPRRPMSSAPAAGAHTAEVLRDLGLDEMVEAGQN